MSRLDPIPALKQQLGGELARVLVEWNAGHIALLIARIVRGSQSSGAVNSIAKADIEQRHVVTAAREWKRERGHRPTLDRVELRMTAKTC